MKGACDAVGLKCATYYRAIKPEPAKDTRLSAKKRGSHRRLSNEQRSILMTLMNSSEFIDQPPREVYAKLLSRGEYHCSWRTMYRVLREQGPVRDRRNQREPRSFAVPRLEATDVNQVWTWDISKIPTFERGVFLNLYVVLDLFSRYVVGWMVAHRESAALAEKLISATCTRQVFTTLEN